MYVINDYSFVCKDIRLANILCARPVGALGYGRRRAGVGKRNSGERWGMRSIGATWFEYFGLMAEGAGLNRAPKP